MDDDELLELIAGLQAADKPPAHVQEAAYQSRRLANLDIELAELIEDSASSVLAGVRAETDRRLVFESSNGVVDIEVRATTMIGRVEPTGLVTIERPDGRTEPTRSADGTSFESGELEPGSVRLQIDTDGVIWRTGWFTV